MTDFPRLRLAACAALLAAFATVLGAEPQGAGNGSAGVAPVNPFDPANANVAPFVSGEELLYLLDYPRAAGPDRVLIISAADFQFPRPPRGGSDLESYAEKCRAEGFHADRFEGPGWEAWAFGYRSQQTFRGGFHGFKSPAVLVVAPSPSAALRPLAEALGIRVRVDPSVAERAAAQFEREVELWKPIQDARALLGTELDPFDQAPVEELVLRVGEQRSPLYLLEVVALHAGAVLEAGDGATWNIRHPRPGNETDRLLEQALTLDNAGWFRSPSFDPRRVCALVGPQVVPSVEAMLGDAPARNDLGDVRGLLECLSRVDSPERDALYVRFLRESVERVRNGGWHPASSVLFETLATSTAPGAEEAMRAYLGGPMDLSARTALAAMGAPPEPGSEGQELRFGTSGAEAAAGPEELELLPQLARLAVGEGSDWIAVESRTAEGPLAVWKGTDSQKGARWEVRLARADADRFVFETSYYCGGLCGHGYEGVAAKVRGRWVLVEVRNTWVS
ncbi:MAG: hypothetical protein SF028_07370 [Candidatus Sumerlaeia bacterium]|nr:hypothetical protein [Candidatus Sumerlaeia bacterium]